MDIEELFVKFNCHGMIFTVLKSNIVKDSFLDSLVKSNLSEKDKDGNFIVNEDPVDFAKVLTFHAQKTQISIPWDMLEYHLLVCGYHSTWVDNWVKLQNPPSELLKSYHGEITPTDKKDKDGNTTWHYLALGGHYDALKLAIIDFGIKDVKNTDGTGIWHCLAWSGNYDGLKLAINEYGIKDVKNNNGTGIWHYLALSGNYDGLKLAVSEFEGIKNVKNNHGTGIWHYLAESGNYDGLKLAINEYGIKDVKNNNGTGIWHYLAMSVLTKP